MLKTKRDCQQSVCSSMLLQEAQNESQLVIIWCQNHEGAWFIYYNYVESQEFLALVEEYVVHT